jgi:hypothetical protein
MQPHARKLVGASNAHPALLLGRRLYIPSPGASGDALVRWFYKENLNYIGQVRKREELTAMC